MQLAFAFVFFNWNVLKVLFKVPATLQGLTKLDKSFDCWMLRTENKADYPSMVCFRSCRYSVKISTTWVHMKWFIISSLESDNKKVTISSAQKSGLLITRSVQKHKLLLVYSPHLPLRVCAGRRRLLKLGVETKIETQ